MTESTRGDAGGNDSSSQCVELAAMFDDGGPHTAEKLLPLVYNELRKVAAAKLAREKSGQTLQATALVHEAYLRLVGSDADLSFANRKHFFAVAAEAMRRILVDQARRKLSVRHGGDWQRVDELPDFPDIDQEVEQTMAVHELLDLLADRYARQAEVAKLRLYLQFTFVEIGNLLGLSADTAESDWIFARAWLRREWGQNIESH